MNKKYLMKSVAVAVLAVAATGCSHDLPDYNAEVQEEFDNNFVNNVLGGQSIDPKQTWSTATNTQVNVSVNLDYDAEYKVYIFAAAPIVGDAAYIGQTTLKSGETKTVNVARPTNAVMLYAACYDKDNHAICKPFIVKSSDTSVAFGESAANATRGMKKATSTGNRWSVTPQSMPDLTAYTTGDLIEMQEAINTNGAGLPTNQADSSERHLKITDSYSGQIARIQSYANQSVYVTGTWTVPEDQRCTGMSVIVVGPTGKIVIPEGHMLSTNANNAEGTTGMIYVQPGGVIEGAGTLQFSNGTQTYSYNAGTIKVKNININGGTLYNAGSLGIDGETDASKLPYLTGPGGTEDVPSKLINLGHCTLDRMDGAGIALENACNMYVINDLCLGKSSKMDNGSYIECGELELNGSNNGGIVLYMGNAAYMNCKGNFAVLNFGVWGPTSNNGGTINNAIFKVNSCANSNSKGRAGCNYTDGLPTTFMLDNVELILPSDWPTGADYAYSGNNDALEQGLGYLDQNASTYRAKLLFHGWYNGYGCRLVNGDNYNSQQVVVGHVQVNEYYGYDQYKTVYTWKEGLAQTAFGDDTRATCIYGSSPSYSVTVDNSDNCGITIRKQPDPQPSTTNYVYYAFEDLGSTKDFDFNDVVLRVATPTLQSDGTYSAKVEILATGGELEAYVLYNGNAFGPEVHSALGGSARVITNTRTVNTALFSQLGTITGLASADVDLTSLPFSLKVIKNGNVTVIGNRRVTGNSQNAGVAPLFVVVNGDETTGKWFWPIELTDISVAYTRFGAWGVNASANLDWYKRPAANKVVNY